MEIKVEEGKVVSIIVDNVEYRLKKPVDLNELAKVYEILMNFLKTFETPIPKPSKEKEEPYLAKALVQYYIRNNKQAELKILKLLLTRNKATIYDLIKEAEIDKLAREKGVPEGKILAGILAGMTRIAKKYGIPNLIRKDEQGNYYIEENIKTLLKTALNMIK